MLFCKNFVIAFPPPLLWHANKNRSPAGVFNENSKDIIQFNNGFKPIGPHVLRTRVRLVTIFLWCVQKPSLGGYGVGEVVVRPMVEAVVVVVEVVVAVEEHKRGSRV